MKIYVGNLHFEFTEDELHQLFIEHGRVESASIARDHQTERPKGFGFVEMPAQEEAQAAIVALNGKEVHQRTLTVNEARPREERSSSNRGDYRPNSRTSASRSDKKGPSKRARRLRR